MIVKYKYDLKLFYDIPVVIDKMRFAYVKKVDDATEM